MVGKGEHRAIADRLPTCGGQNRKPVCFVGNPRQPPIAADEALGAARDHWVLATKTFIDKMALEKPEYGYSPLNGCIPDWAHVRPPGCEERAGGNPVHGQQRETPRW